ncbi:hypothetical protein M3231_16070 [Neobacillus mesonae]|nr:hypothetical protein [Neobacillus mesonae]
MTDKNILAYFNSPDQAQQVAAKLKSLMIQDISIDRFSRYPGEGSNEVILNGAMDSLASVTQDGTFTNSSSGILAAADPSASGMSDGGAGGPTGKDILLTVVVDESSHHEALRIIEESGGLI